MYLLVTMTTLSPDSAQGSVKVPDSEGDSAGREPRPATRREHDLLGERDVPASALYGIQTLRAMENFAISGVELSDFPTLIAAIAAVKEAAAEANRDLGFLEPRVADAIVAACREIRAAGDHFIRIHV